MRTWLRMLAWLVAILAIFALAHDHAHPYPHPGCAVHP